MEVVNKIADLPVDQRERPLVPVSFISCGEIGDTKDYILNDPFSKENIDKIKDVNKYNRLFFEEEENYKEPDPEVERLKKLEKIE